MRKISSKDNTRIVTVLMIILVLAVLSLTPLTSAQVDEFCDVTTTAAGTPGQEHAATQLPAEVGQPVRWVKQVDVQNLFDQAVSELTVSVPEYAQNIEVTDLNEEKAVLFQAGIGEITIIDSLDFNEQKSYLIRYETEPPEKQETNLQKDGNSLTKSVIVSSDNHYEDVLTYTDLPEMTIADIKDTIQLYWVIDGVKTDITKDPDFDIHFYDTNNNGMYDRMSWVAPHLSTQIFEVVIFSDADPGNYSSIGIDLLYPADGAYITSTSSIGFNYSVHYNSSTTVYCNLTVDGLVKRENIQTSADTEITTYFNLSTGYHTWFVNCAGDNGSANTSTARGFRIDLDTPVITLDTPDYHVSYTDSIDLNFTPVDNDYPVLVCSMSINGALNTTSIIASNNTQQTLSLSGLSNGVYDWNVSCEDAAGNSGSSEERVFYISKGTPSEFNITSNKGTYSIGETGYLIINARAGSNLTMFVDTPARDSFFKYYNGASFPLIDMINFTNNAGMYNIDGIFSSGGNMYVVRTSLEVTSTFHVDIESNETTGEPGTSFNFEANATGGIGGVTYEWDFGDDSTANGTDVDHTFSSVGEFTVELTATDSSGNTATDTQKINIFDKHDVKIILKELQTGNLLADKPVEVGDQRKSTDSNGEVNFSVYEGKQRIYVSLPGYEWYKNVLNITEDITLTIELNNTGITDYTPPGEADNKTTQAEQDAQDNAELILSKVDVALEELESSDTAAKSVLEALGVQAKLQNARKELRQIIRDLGNTESSKDLTDEEKETRVAEITAKLGEFNSLITKVEVKDTTEYVDYPKASDISMLSTEYLRYKKLEYSNGEKSDYIEANTELQADITITTRLSIVEMSRISGDPRAAAVVINKLTKSPVNTDGLVLIEYIPKEAAKSASDITKVTAFDVVKSDPILKFDPSIESYAYYIEGDAGIEDLKKIKHVLLYDPEEDDKKGLPGVTGFSILSKLKIDNPKLAAQIAVIILLLLAYLVYHFELIDQFRDWRTKRNPGTAPYQTDTAYNPESKVDIAIGKVKSFIRKEDDIISREISHIKSLMMLAHSHAENRNHDDAHDTYKKVTEEYKTLSKEAKGAVHHETKHVYNKIVISKINHLLDDAMAHVNNNQQGKAKDHYSEIKQLYTRLEKEHRAAVSERCMKLHETLFERSLT